MSLIFLSSFQQHRKNNLIHWRIYMIRKFTTILFSVLLIASSLFAQTAVKLNIAVFGVSPRDAAKSTTDIYTYQSTGLNNVGVGTLNYFKASINGKKFVSPVYTLTRKPSASKATIGTIIDKQNDSTQVVAFTPDVVGAYEVTVTDGGYTSVVVMNAAKFLGYTNTIVNGVDTKVSCKTCHASKVTSFEKTNHASMFTRAMNGTPGLSGPSDHYSVNCISCHTTGFDKSATAVNDGFDDFTFTFPTVLAAGGFDKLVTQFPDAMKRANIQCESCHGPAGSHLGVTTDFRIQANFDADVCAYCHDSGTHHIFPEQWDGSIHAGATSYPTGAGRESCVRCHTGAGFAQFADGVPTTDPYFDVSYSSISCAGCHDPHDAKNEKQLRKIDGGILVYNSTTKGTDETPVTGAGLGAFCINCHHGRSEPISALAATTISTRFGPHYGPQGDIITGNNLIELGGVKLAKSNHLGATVNACITCHMYTGTSVVNNQVMQWGGHSFSMSTFKKDASGNFVIGPNGRRVTDKDNMQACAQCHGSTFGTSFGDVKFFLNGSGDHDNDGVVEGLQDEVFGMIKKIMTELGKIPGVTFSAEYGQYDAAGKFTGFPVPTSKWTKDQLSAYWNAKAVHDDKSMGIHNPKYIVTALKGAMALLGIPVGISKQAEMPSTYALYQNYPNPFNPTTNIKFSIPQSGNVKLVVYYAIGREVATLVNNFLNAGSYNFDFNARGLASGVYLYRLETSNFVKVNKMLLIK